MWNFEFERLKYKIYETEICFIYNFVLVFCQKKKCIDVSHFYSDIHNFPA